MTATRRYTRHLSVYACLSSLLLSTHQCIVLAAVDNRHRIPHSHVWAVSRHVHPVSLLQPHPLSRSPPSGVMHFAFGHSTHHSGYRLNNDPSGSRFYLIQSFAQDNRNEESACASCSALKRGVAVECATILSESSLPRRQGYENGVLSRNQFLAVEGGLSRLAVQYMGV